MKDMEKVSSAKVNYDSLTGKSVIHSTIINRSIGCARVLS